MIDHPDFTVEPWCLRATDLDFDVLAQTESVFALSNGQIGWRANLDEGEPHGLPGSYLNGVFEERPLPYAEAGYGYPESGQTVINVTNGKLIRLLVDDEPFDIRYGELRAHERMLDFRAGVLHRDAEWTSPTDGRFGSPRPEWCPSSNGRWPRSATRCRHWMGRCASSSSRSWWQTSSCLHRAGIRAWLRCWRRHCGPKLMSATMRGWSWCIAPSTAGYGWPRRWTTSWRDRRVPRPLPRPTRTWAG